MHASTGTKINTYRSAAAESEPISKSYGANAFAAAKPELTAPRPTPERCAHLEGHGFVITTDFVGNPWIPILQEAGRRVTEAYSLNHGYSKIDCSKGYTRRKTMSRGRCEGLDLIQAVSAED